MVTLTQPKGTEENRDKQQEAIIMKNKISFAELMQQNGFQHMGKTTYDGRFIYEREWRKTTDLAWYGEKESTYRIEAMRAMARPSSGCMKMAARWECATIPARSAPSTPSARSSAAPGIPCERRRGNEQTI